MLAETQVTGIEIDEAATLTGRLVSTPSLTLARRQAPPDDRYGEAGMAALVRKWLSERGIPSEAEEIEPGRPQVLAKIGRGAPEILLTSHLDTVPPVSWEADPFTPRRDGHRLIGLGACDDKGPLAAMLLAFSRLAQDPNRPPGTVTLIGMVGEEMFGVGSVHLAQSGYRPDAAVVGEPTELRVIRCECGNVRWQIVTRGRAAHGSRPWTGESALYRMADVLRFLRDQVAPERQARTHALVGSAAFNAGLIVGGAAINIVPDRCLLSVEMRILPGEDPGVEMAAVNGAVARAVGAEHLEFLPPVALNHPLHTPETDPLVSAFRTTLPAFHLDATPGGVSFGSDANRLAAVNIPCVLFGPGSIAQAHTRDEWVDIREVAVAARVYEAATREYLSAGRSGAAS